jgi:TetR/AcrR family transcriptional regulator
LIIKVTLPLIQHRPQGPNKVRVRRSRTDIREALLESALAEFGAKGFDGASTRAIARRVQVHQPQINYHFESKAALWTAAVDYLFGLLGEALDGALPVPLTAFDVSQLAAAFAEILYYVLIGAASLPYVNAPEFRLLTERDPSDPHWIDAHARALVTILLPGLGEGTT